MKYNEGIDLLQNTFVSDFDLIKYSTFIKELFNTIQINIQDKTSYIANQYREYITDVRKIGDFEDDYKKKMEILAVKLKRNTSRDRARTMQRNFVASWLGKLNIDGALVAFYGDEPEDWRFSFIKMEYHLIKDKAGKVIFEKELTPAKRYSFLVGVNEPNHTCQSCFLQMLMEEDVNPSLESIEKAFSIDNVTKEFFEKYKELFLELNESLERLIYKNTNIKREFENKGISTIDFSKKLLGQIVFIYFLQKKGWLGVGKNADGTFKEWGTGPRNFIRKLFNKEIIEYNNFFNDILEPLFYEALATERDNDYYRMFECKIPFLNGGLFEPINDYDWTGMEILLDNSIFNKILETFDRFNFTVKEDEPLEKEVAVDPEMLGKVFENLLEVKDRKSKGAFYTPREIVHHMCQQSLINYLGTNSSIFHEDIEKFVLVGDFALDLTLRALEQKKIYHGKNYVKEAYIIPRSIEENYQEIDKLLKVIKIVDPAVGSGAFPVGMMNEIVKARSNLSIFFPLEEQEKRTDYNLKRETIENCLYGVDIEPSAVEIAKLRFWLSLIVDEDDIKNIKPLPNLDHKIMCGNSLLEEFEGIYLFNDKLLGESKKDNTSEIAKITKEIGELCLQKRNIALGKLKGKSLKNVDNEINRLEKKKKFLLVETKDMTQATTFDDDSGQSRIRESQQKLNELKKLQRQYFNEQNRKIKKRLQDDIDRIEWEFIELTLKEQDNEKAGQKLAQYKKNKAKPFFLWKLYFSEVFQRENPGFDVVIANPPYDVVSDIKLKELFNESIFGRFNLYGLFIHKTVRSILRNKGVLSFINPKTLLADLYFINLRKYLIKNGEFVEIIKIIDRHKIFDEVLQACIIIIFTKIQPLYSHNIRISEIAERKDIGNPIVSLNVSRQDVYQSEQFNYCFFCSNRQEGYSIWKKILNLSKPLTSFGFSFTTGKIQWDKFKDFFVEKPSKGAVRLIWAENIQRFSFKSTSKRIGKEYLKNSPMKPNIIDETIITQRVTADEQEYRIIATIFSPSEFNAFSENHTNYLENKSDKLHLNYILACLNSKLYDFIFRHLSSNTQVSSGQLNTLPFYNLPMSQQKSFIENVNRILVITKDDDYLNNLDKRSRVKDIERAINRDIYNLYGLTEEEIDLVEERYQEK